MKIILFGTGDYYNRFKHWFEDSEVLALIDNSECKQGSIIDGIAVISPSEVLKLDYDYIVVLSFYIKQMRQQLVNLGIPNRKILHFYELGKILNLQKQINFHVPDKDLRQKILLLSHDLNLGGPSLALMHMAEVLKSQGKYVVFASMIEGPLREQIETKDIIVVVDNNLQIGTMNDISWTHQFDVIICNTINYYNFLSKRDLEGQFIWWLHDSLFFYDGVDKCVLENIPLQNMRVVSVGPVPKQALTTYRKDIEISNLFYEVEDTMFENPSTKTSCIPYRFLTIGYVESRKGQDILVDAIELLPEYICKKCEFYIVGPDSSVFAEEIKQRAQKYPNIKIAGVINREGIELQYQFADMLICPSREDPMPTVVSEALMHSIPVIASDAIGTAGLLTDQVDSLLFKSEDAFALANLIEWAISNTSEIQNMGKEGRKVYEKYFSRKAFEEKVNLLLQ